MPYETVHDVLEFAAEFHARLSRYYVQLASIAEAKRVRLLLDYLQRQQQDMADGFVEYEKDAAAKLMQTYLQYTPEESLQSQFPSPPLPADMSIDDVVQVAENCADVLIRLYDAVANQSVPLQMRELFLQLKQREEAEKAQIIRSALNLKEL